jgi:hypothetical protein
VEQNLEFIPNRTTLNSAHLQATNKIGPRPDVSCIYPPTRMEHAYRRGSTEPIYDGQQHIPDFCWCKSDGVDLHICTDFCGEIHFWRGSPAIGSGGGSTERRAGRSS